MTRELLGQYCDGPITLILIQENYLTGKLIGISMKTHTRVQDWKD